MMHTTNLKRDIDKLKVTFPDSLIMGYQLRDLEERLKHAEEQEQVTNHPIIQEYVTVLKSQLKGIEDRLSTEKSDTLTDRQRDGLIDLKEVYSYFIRTFTQTDKVIEDVQRSVEALKEANNIV